MPELAPQVRPLTNVFRCFAAVLGILLSGVSDSAWSQTPIVAPQALQAALGVWVAGGFPSLSLALATSCGVVWAGAAGESDLTGRKAALPSALYGIGSITKTYVAVIILQLADEGRIRLDETPADILGGSTLRGVPNATTARISQLLNHTSGIPSWEDVPRWIRQARGSAYDPGRHWNQVNDLDYIRGMKPVAPPGQSYSYSNTNYNILGLIIEKVTGRPLTVEFKERILHPLGLRNTFLEGFEPEPDHLLAHRYQFATAEFQRTAGISKLFPEIRPGLIDVSRSRLSPEWAAGGIVTTASDLATFAVALRDGRLLKPTSLAIMMDWKATGTPGYEAGRGLFRRALGGGVYEIGNTGAVLGFGADMGWLETGDAVLVSLSNVGSIDAGSVPLDKEGGRAFLPLAVKFAAEHSRCDPGKPR